MGSVDELMAIVRSLRAEGGCPWDRAQTPASLRPMLVEEVYEVLEAIDAGDDRAMREEMGDLLFTIALLAQMRAEAEAFTLEDAAATVCEKMVRRHPHVFAGADYTGLPGWEAIKAAERAERSDGTPPSALDGVPAALPALIQAQRIGKKAASTGFDWPSIDGARAKLDEELAELDEALDGAQISRVEEELGDVLFSVVNVARHAGVSAEDCLRAATRKFARRFRRLEDAVRAEGGDAAALDGEALEARWQALKGGD
ncbi:MAG: nucleoside triphosphate pyrophosphohydrolase [Alphaproteobacteria bacterium]|nr:nucleoside triphosphate pyrophosphohydrolase [Alphaproteobacteria bacterium]